jgi:hypothetical protein
LIAISLLLEPVTEMDPIGEATGVAG